MIRVRPEVAALSPYVAGRTAARVADEIGVDVDEIVKLASNEAPQGPFPGALEAGVGSLGDSNRYPDNAASQLSAAVAGRLGLAPDNIWFGAGSSALLREIAMAVGGEGTSAVMPTPSFVIYRMATRLAGADAIEIPLDEQYTVSLDAMRAAIRPDTTVVYVCAPNNPTGTVNSASDLMTFVESVPPDVLVVVDEAYGEYVATSGWKSMVPEVVGRPNVVVTKTFSKVFALAALRVGYAVGHPETLAELRKAQAPFTVTTVAQGAALASWQNAGELATRIEANAAGRNLLETGLAERGVVFVPSEANFTFLPSPRASEWFASLQSRGVITRVIGGGLRVSVGTPEEVAAFFAAWDALGLD